MQGFFRKAALEKVSSPEQLDLLMQVTSPMGWLALLTMGLILLIVVVWSVLGSIPDLVDGQGVLIRGERIYEVKSSMAGTLTQLNVTTDGNVTQGQVIAVISRDRASIEERQADEISIARNEEMLKIKQGELASLRQQRETQADLVRRGLKAANVLFDYERKINDTLGEINSLERENGIIKTRMKATAEITSPESGRVVEVIKSYGDKVAEGEPLIRLELKAGPEPGGEEQREFCGGAIHAILYVPADAAGKVQPGQPARVSPLGVKREEYGYIVGRVEWVAPFAASPEDMREKLKNEKLVQTYNSQGPVFETRVCLTPDPSNKNNGFKWSSGRGPDRPVSSGVQCNASLVVNSRRPYTFVIPAIRRTVGI